MPEELQTSEETSVIAQLKHKYNCDSIIQIDVKIAEGDIATCYLQEPSLEAELSLWDSGILGRGMASTASSQVELLICKDESDPRITTKNKKYWKAVVREFLRMNEMAEATGKKN